MAGNASIEDLGPTETSYVEQLERIAEGARVLRQLEDRRMQMNAKLAANLITKEQWELDGKMHHPQLAAAQAKLDSELEHLENGPGDVDPTEPSTVLGLLAICDVTVDLDVIKSWTQGMRKQASEWAGATHLAVTDNTVAIPDKPEFLPSTNSEQGLPTNPLYARLQKQKGENGDDSGVDDKR